MSINLSILKRSRKKPKVGDVFAMHMPSKGWLFGRVVSTSVRNFPEEISDPDAPAWILVYVYRDIVPDCTPHANMSPQDLLVPPIITGDSPWLHGLFRTVDHQTLGSDDVLSTHCFFDFIYKLYRDESGNVLPHRLEPCGDGGIATSGAIDRIISDALGVPPPPDEDSDETVGCAENEVILCLPDSEDGTRDLMAIETPLVEAVERIDIAEYEGHGFDLETGVADIRFSGPKPKRIAEVLLPVLRTLALPAGSYLLVGHRNGTKRIDL